MSRITRPGSIDLLPPPLQEDQGPIRIADLIREIVRGPTERVDRGEVISDILGNQPGKDREVLPLGPGEFPGPGTSVLHRHFGGLVGRIRTEAGQIFLDTGLWHDSIAAGAEV